MKRVVLLLLSSAITASCLADSISTGILIDRVWSGHPVGFDMLTERGYQFIAYFDAERRLTVKGRNLDDMDWTTVHPEGHEVSLRNRMSNVTGWDTHNYLTMALDRDGCLHLSGNMHADPLVYYRTSRPFDLKTLQRLDRMTGEREAKTTYPRFLIHDKGDLVFSYRDGGSGDGSDLYNIYDSTTQTWRRLFEGPLLDGEGERSAYSLLPRRGPDGRFHLLWMWRDTPDAMTNHTLSYARSSDLIHWESSSGKPIKRPITISNAEVVDPAKPGGGLMNASFALGFDAEKRPMAVYHRFDQHGNSQAFVARPTGEDKWMTRQISNWNFRWDFAGGGSQQVLINFNAPIPVEDDQLAISFSGKLPGSGRWILNRKTLEVIETLPASKSIISEDFEKPIGTFPGLSVRTKVSTTGADRWLLRWETLEPNRDLEARETPPPSELFLYKCPTCQSKPDYFLTNPGNLAAVKERLTAGDESLKPALDALLKSANAAMKVKPPSVTQKTKPAPSGDVHDYASTAPYLWPDPSKPDGLPYIAKDGEINPESRTTASDLKRVELMAKTVETLAFAYFFSGNEDYATHAAECLKAWFINPATRMKPNLNYAQGVPGLNEGRPIGIIEGGSLVTAGDAAGLLVNSESWTTADDTALKGWMKSYLQWLTDSEFGKREREMKQNHGTSYDVQIMRLALMLGRTDLAKQTAENVKTQRIALQIQPDGSQPMELKRTKAFNYSRLNLHALTMLAILGDRVGVDLWHFVTPDGRSIRKAVDFMLPYVKTPPERWPYPQIVPLNRSELAIVFRLAGLTYQDPKYEKVVSDLPASESAIFQLLYPLTKSLSN